MKRIAACITPHGFGHSTRTIAILESLQARYPGMEIALFTTVPEHLFTTSLHNITFHPVVSDVGIIQQDALRIDIPATIEALDSLLPYNEKTVSTVAEAMDGCSSVLCDIAPLGILGARAAGVPSVLIENFTWDWIYQAYIEQYPQFSRHIQTLSSLYSMADHHIQVEPVCNPTRDCLTFPPVFRKSQGSAQDIRKSLGIKDRKLVVITMGGTEFSLPALPDHDDCFFVVTGQPAIAQLTANCLALSHNSTIYHPDLICAADLVVCKTGYSTLAECYQAGTRIAAVTRPSFRESMILAEFAKQHMQGTVLTEEEFFTEKWLDLLPEILSSSPSQPAMINGANSIADFLISLK